MRTALISGITGQDGTYLTEFLLGKGYAVHGIVRQMSPPGIHPREPFSLAPGGCSLSFHLGDLRDTSALRRIVNAVQPDEIYNLGGQSRVQASFEDPEYTMDVVALGALRLLEAVCEYTDRTATIRATIKLAVQRCLARLGARVGN